MKKRLKIYMLMLLCLTLVCGSLAVSAEVTEEASALEEEAPPSEEQAPPSEEQAPPSEESSASEEQAPVPPKGEGHHEHSWIAGETVKPKCEAEGYTIYTCECGESKQDDLVSALGHDWKPITITLPSCDSVGFTEYRCARCLDTKFDDEVAPVGHDWTDWALELESTCDVEGRETRRCRECGEVETRLLPFGHEWDDQNVCVKCHRPAVAKVGGVMYVSLQIAIESAGDQTVELMADGACMLPENKPVTIDRKGFELELSVPEGCTLMQEGDVYVALKAYAEVNGEAYTSLAEAVAAANPGDEVRVLADETGKTVMIDKDLTIDFNGFTYTAKDPGGEREPTDPSSGAAIELAKDTEVLLKNGAILGKGNAKYLIQNNSKQLTLQDMTLDALPNANLVYALSNNYGVVFLSGATNISAGVGQWAIDLWKSDAAGVQLILSEDMTGAVAGYVRISDGCTTFMDESKYMLVSKGVDEESGFPYYCIAIVMPTPTPTPTPTPSPSPTVSPTPTPSPSPSPSPTATKSSGGGSSTVNSSSKAEGDLNSTGSSGSEKDMKYYSYQALRWLAGLLSGGIFGD